MTEDEARQKWCPFVREVICGQSERLGSYNRFEGTQAGCNCIASDCMAFRWVPEHNYELDNGFVVITDIVDNYPSESISWDGKYPRFGNQRIHRHIAEKCFGPIPDGYYVDHIDGDVLNNRRGNLRIVTPQQSGANQKSRGGASEYRGVSKGRGDKWFAQLASGGIRWHIGTFDTEEQAAAAYDEKAKDVHGEFARLNLEPKTNSGRHGYCGLAGK